MVRVPDSRQLMLKLLEKIVDIAPVNNSLTIARRELEYRMLQRGEGRGLT